MKLIAIGIGGSGASCLECLVHLSTLGLLPEETDLIPVMVDPDQQHPRIQAASRFIAAHATVRSVGGAATDGLFGTRMSRVVNANALRPSERANLFSLLGIWQPSAKSAATLFFSEAELGGPGTNEFDDGYYGRVNAGVCFFNDPIGRHDLMAALRQHVLGGDAVIVLIGSAFGGTGAAGLIHVARVFREDPQLQHVPFKIGAIQLEPYFRPDQHPGAIDEHELVNIPDTFEGRAGAAFQFLADLAANENLPFDAFYPLGVRTPASFPPDWFKRDQQNNPHLFIEYVAALAAIDFVLNQADLSNHIRHCREAVVPFQGPLALLRESLYDATTMHAIVGRYLVPLVEGVTHTTSLPGHPWIATVGAKSAMRPSQLLEHLQQVDGLLSDVLIAAGVTRQEAIARAGASDVERRDAERRNDLTRDSFPVGLAPRAENFDVVETLRFANPEGMFDSYEIARDGKLPLRALHRWIGRALHPVDGETLLPPLDRHVGATFHQWTQQGSTGNVLGIQVPPDDEFHSDPSTFVLRRLAASPWHRPAGIPRTSGEYPSIWAPALVHRDELYSASASAECRYLHLGLLAVSILTREHLATAPVRLIPAGALLETFQRSLMSTFPMAADGPNALIAPGGLLAIYESEHALGPDDVPDATDVIGFFYPETLVVPAAGISPERRRDLIGMGEYAAGRGLPRLLHSLLANNWVQTLQQCKVPNAVDCGQHFINFLDGFTNRIEDKPFVSTDRFGAFPVAQAAPWIHRLYR